MKQLLVATRNRGKLKEIEALLAGLVERVISIADMPGIVETVEDGKTFAENALKKGREASEASGLPVIADDSGLVVTGLGGAPGVFSARYAGEGAGDLANNCKLMKMLAATPDADRSAAFVCCLAFVTPDGEEQLFEGRVTGRIIDTPRGENGFGYDPLFLVDGFQQTMAELPLDQKNIISHRGKALAAFKKYLEHKR